MYKILTLGNILIFLTFYGYSQTKNFIDTPYIETSAQVDTLVVPDKIYLYIIITEKDTKGKTSVEELEANMVAALKGLGINTEEKLSLYDLASNFKKYLLKGQDVLKIKSYNLLVEDAVTAGKVILTLEKLNISNIGVDKTEYSQMEKLQLELRTKAILKAKRQAEALVSPLHQKVGNAIFISDISDSYIEGALQGQVAGIQIRGFSSPKKGEYKPADIQFKKIRVESTVNVKFRLE